MKSLYLTIVLLFAMRACQSVSGQDMILDITDANYRTACGPICCYAALKSLGCEADLSTIAKECHWTEGKRVRFQSLFDLLRHRTDVSCSLVKMSPYTLAAALKPGNRVAIIPIRTKDSMVDHAMVLLRSSESVFSACDYPNLNSQVFTHDLIKVWDGETLLVELSKIGWLEQNWVLLVLPSAAVIVSLMARRKKC